MELLTFVLVWPFLILTTGLVFITVGDVFLGGIGDSGSPLILYLILLGLIMLLLFGRHKKPTQPSIMEQLEELKRVIIMSSIALLFPILTRYLVGGFSQSIMVIIIALIVSFGLIAVGMFLKSHRVLTYSSIFGGALALIYLYSQLWSLGEGTRIIAAAFGLTMAVSLSIAKLKDKLV